MNNETKRNVFEKLAERYADVYDAYYDETGSLYHYDDESDYLSEYENALPDDLPVIPKAVGEYLKSNRTDPLGKVFWHLGCISVALLGSTRSYIVNHTEDFALAWVLGVWRVACW